MSYSKDYLPQFRESGMDGLVGIKGYLNYFQDMATIFFHQINKGNDVIPEQYGISWIYTRYKLTVNKKADFGEPLHMETWVSKQDVRVRQDLVISRNGEIYAQGRLESCLIRLDKKILCKPNEIELPPNLAEERQVDIGPFEKLVFKTEEMEPAYTYTVLFTDLDKSKHMNNLHYADLFLNAFTPEFYETHIIKSFELQFDAQCFYGDKLTVMTKEIPGFVYLTAVNQEGKIISRCRIGVKKI